jgi:hypothetical protein
VDNNVPPLHDTSPSPPLFPTGDTDTNNHRIKINRTELKADAAAVSLGPDLRDHHLQDAPDFPAGPIRMAVLGAREWIGSFLAEHAPPIYAALLSEEQDPYFAPLVHARDGDGETLDDSNGKMTMVGHGTWDHDRDGGEGDSEGDREGEANEVTIIPSSQSPSHPRSQVHVERMVSRAFPLSDYLEHTVIQNIQKYFV